MHSGKALGLVLTGLLDSHVLVYVGLDDSQDIDDPLNFSFAEFSPCCCYPCQALAEYFFTPRGRAEMDVFIRQAPMEAPSLWQNPDWSVNWEIIEAWIARSKCGNCGKEWRWKS
jgi:hypothetical protein